MTTHYPTRRPAVLRWLPLPCACGAPRFDRCPDAVADAQAGHDAPLGGAYPITRIPKLELFDNNRPAREEREWWAM